MAIALFEHDQMAYDAAIAMPDESRHADDVQQAVACRPLLGEADVRDIQNPADHAFPIAFFQNDLEMYAERVQKIRDKNAREKAISCLKRVRCSLESVQGRDMIRDRHGRYIVVMPDQGSDTEYAALAKAWFGGIDKDLHIYAAGAASARQTFHNFKTDSSDHLRLFCCDDAFPEAVDAEEVSGVILLRPMTCEQIICGNGDAYPACRELLLQLERTLSASWDTMYSCAEQYYREHASLAVPDDYYTEQGFSLPAWLRMQRHVRSGKINGILTDEQIEKLDKLEMHWDGTKDVVWDRLYSAARAYFLNMHHLQPAAAYVTADGIRLGAWLAQLRTARKIGLNSSYLTPEHIAELDAIGMVWDVNDFVFERNYHAAVEYYQAHGDLECKPGFVDGSGIRLGAWLSNLRAQYQKQGSALLTEEQFRMLNAIGMRWGRKFDQQWDMYFGFLASYVKRTGNTDVPATWKEGDIPLGRWYRRQKELYGRGELRQDRAERLLSLGVNLIIEDPWEMKYQLAKAYSETHGGSLNVPHDYVVQGVWLSKWLNEMRLLGEGKRKKKLTEEQRQKLASIGMVFGQTNADLTWERHFQAVKEYMERTGSTELPLDLRDESAYLKNWLDRQIKCLKKDGLSAEKAEKIRSLGAVSEETDAFEVGFEHAKAYFDKFGDLLIDPEEYTCSDGYELRSWIRSIRNQKKNGALPDDQIKRLETIGMVWEEKKIPWNTMFEAAKEFAVPGNPLVIPLHQRAANGRDLYDWYMRQQRRYAEGRLPDDKLKKLLSIGAVMEQTCIGSIRKASEESRDIKRRNSAFLGNAVNE